MQDLALSRRLTALKPSATLAAAAKAKALKAQGKDVLQFTLGEPDFSTPFSALKATAEYLLSDKVDTHYSGVSGTPGLREAIAKKLLHDNALRYAPEEIVVTPGAKFAIVAAMTALLDPGDEVLVPTPTWVSYFDIIESLCDGVAVRVSTHANRFRLTAAALETHITPKTKALLYSSPNNPTGTMIEPDEIKKIASLCKKHRIAIVADEIYDKLTYGSVKHVSIASLDEETRAITLTINGMSKAFAMTGERVGYIAGSKQIIKAIADYQGQTTNNVSNTAQFMARMGLERCDDDVKIMQKAFAQRRAYVLKRLSAMGLECAPVDGAFYAFFDHSHLEHDSVRFAQRLLDEKLVAVVAGKHFDGEGFCRFSFATDMKTLERGLDRLEEFVKTYHALR